MALVFALAGFVAIAQAEIIIDRFNQQLGNAKAVLVSVIFPYAIRHGCVVRLTENIEAGQLATASAVGKYNGHDPMGPGRATL